MATAHADAGQHITAYWTPGCTSCLRMKEFLEHVGVDYDEVNVAEHPERAADLAARGLSVPALLVGDTIIPGLDLVAIAKLIGVEYTQPEMLAPAALHDKYLRVNDALCRMLAQLSVEQLDFRLPDRDRTLCELASHAGAIMRAFVAVYDAETYDRELEIGPTALRTSSGLIEWARETEAQFTRWWERDGFDDPLDRVVETYWGHRSLHEVLERATWHPAQHVRQVALCLENLGVAPDSPLTPDDLAGLPVPERVQA
jgi:glutaredoxin